MPGVVPGAEGTGSTGRPISSGAARRAERTSSAAVLSGRNVARVARSIATARERPPQ